MDTLTEGPITITQAGKHLWLSLVWWNWVGPARYFGSGISRITDRIEPAVIQLRRRTVWSCASSIEAWLDLRRSTSHYAARNVQWDWDDGARVSGARLWSQRRPVASFGSDWTERPRILITEFHCPMLRQFIELYRGFSRIQSLIHTTRTELNCSVNSPIGVHVFLTERPSSLQCPQPINTKYKLSLTDALDCA